MNILGSVPGARVPVRCSSTTSVKMTILAGALLTLFAAGSAPGWSQEAAGAGEMSTVLNLVNSGRPANEKVPAERIHIAHPKSFPKATLVGFFTGSRGVLLGDIMVDGKLYVANSAAPLLLQQAGWDKASGPERQALALQWLDECVLAFGDTLLRTTPSKTGDAAKIKPLAVQSLGDGGVRVNGWIQEDPGRNSGQFYRRILYIFGPHGQIVRGRQIDRFYQES
jgi:hypothetical protein